MSNQSGLRKLAVENMEAVFNYFFLNKMYKMNKLL